MNVVHIESRRSRRRNSEYEIMVNLECENSEMEELTGMLRREVSCLSLDEYDEGREFPQNMQLVAQESFGWILLPMLACFVYIPFRRNLVCLEFIS